MKISLKAIWNNKCPRCRQGDIFTQPFKIEKPLAMPEKCEYCEQATQPEPGFYFGAMFISYLISVFMLLIPVLIFVFYFKWSVGGAMGIAILIAVFTYLKLLRGSRTVWFHLMVAYDPKIANEVKERIEMMSKSKIQKI